MFRTAAYRPLQPPSGFRLAIWLRGGDAYVHHTRHIQT